MKNKKHTGFIKIALLFVKALAMLLILGWLSTTRQDNPQMMLVIDTENIEVESAFYVTESPPIDPPNLSITSPTTPSINQMPIEEVPPAVATPLMEAFAPLQYALHRANIRRSEIERPNQDMLLPLVYGREPASFDLEPFFPARGQWHIPASITYYEALTDVDAVFNILRYVYGAYTYFGGDEVFEPVKAAILEDIGQFETLSPRGDFLPILHYHLSQVISDNHFWLDNTRLSADSIFYINDDAAFDKTDRGFRHRENGLYVEHIIGHDLQSIFRLTVDEAGQLFYTPVIYADRDSRFGASTNITLEYEDGTMESLILRVAVSTRTNWQTAAGLRYVEDIPVVNLEWMMGLSSVPYGQYAQQFLNFAEALRDEPIVIMDIRSNTGGMPVLPAKWIYLLTGTQATGNHVTLVNWPYYEDYTWAPWGETPEDNPFYFSADDWDDLAFITGDYDNFHSFLITSTAPRQVTEREHLLIMLVDRYTASAGEMFTDMVFNIENTLVIGQNTSGTLLTDIAYPELRLPHSGLRLGLGMSINVYPKGHLPEGIGIRPDIWAVGDALTAALELLR